MNQNKKPWEVSVGLGFWLSELKGLMHGFSCGFHGSVTRRSPGFIETLWGWASFQAFGCGLQGFGGDGFSGVFRAMMDPTSL